MYAIIIQQFRNQATTTLKIRTCLSCYQTSSTDHTPTEYHFINKNSFATKFLNDLICFPSRCVSYLNKLAIQRLQSYTEHLILP
jgi:hypothetical protein